jgi:lipoprotein NlpI
LHGNPTGDDSVVRVPVYWSDVDLHAWSGLDYRPLAPYEHLPVEVNRPASPFDLNNLAYDVMTISDWNVLRLFDDALAPLNRGTQPTTRGAERLERDVRVRGGPVAEGVAVVNPVEATLSDYTWTSVGNLKRIDGLVNLLQRGSLELDREVAESFGRDNLPVAPVVNDGIDDVQEGVWELYRFTQRLVAQIVDETVLNGLEDGTARAINSFHRVPAEVRVASQTVRGQSPVGDEAPPATAEVEEPLTEKERAEFRTRYEQAVENATERIEQNPRNGAAYSARGDAYFFLGEFEKSLADYERTVQLDPALGDSHWRRGIARFYAGKHETAAAQFEAYHSFDNVDRENGIWRYLSQHRAHGRKQAREGLLKYEKTDREPFPDVYKLFAGEIEPAAILNRIAEARITETERASRLFYAHLYIGLNESVEGRDESALENLRRATANDWAPTAGFGPTWMWHVARVHHDVLAAKIAEKTKPD